MQIHADAEPLAEATGLKLGLAYGGDGYDKQLKVLESGVDILIGTTGRLIDYAKQNHINLGRHSGGGTGRSRSHVRSGLY